MTLETKLLLWMDGSGIDQEKSKQILADKKVQYVMANAPNDGLWLMEALNSAGSPLGVRPVDRKNPREQLQFLGIMG